MTSGGVLVLLFLLGCGALSVATLVIAARGGRGPADPPASHRPADPAGFPAARGVLHRRGPRDTPAPTRSSSLVVRLASPRPAPRTALRR